MPREGARGARPYLTSTLHPAHILRGGDGEQQEDGDGGRGVDLLYFLFQADIAKAVQLAEGRIVPWRDNADLFAWYVGDPDEHHKLKRQIASIEARLGRGIFGEPIAPDRHAALEARLAQLRATLRGLPPAAGIYRVGASDEDPDIIEWGDLATVADVEAAMETFRDDARRAGRFAADTETTGIDNLTCTLTAASAATRDGGIAASWPVWQAAPRALQMLRELYADEGLVKDFHNKLYDGSVLRRHELPLRGHVGCTLLKHHGAYPGLPHDLGTVAQQWFVTRPWKVEFRRGTKDEAALIVYNYRDSQACAHLSPTLDEALVARRTTRVYECDRQLADVAGQMRVTGYWVDRREQARLSRLLHARHAWMRAALQQDFTAIEPAWRQALAELAAQRPRKKDAHLSYLERVALRHSEIAKRKRRDSDVGLFKPKSKFDLVALFRVLSIPVFAYTEKTNLPVTDKKAMEVAAARHPLFRRLNAVREVTNTLALFVDGLPIAEDGRVHPNWAVHKITGRWSAGKSQNVQYNVPAWPPEEEADEARSAGAGDRERAARGVQRGLDPGLGGRSDQAAAGSALPEAPAAPVPGAAACRPAGDLASLRAAAAGVRGDAPSAPEGLSRGSKGRALGSPVAARLELGEGGGADLPRGSDRGGGALATGGGRMRRLAAAEHDPLLAPRPGYRWKTTPSGEFIVPRENPRAQVTAPTAEEILALYEERRAALGDAGATAFAGGREVVERARAGFGRMLIGADFGQVELRIAGYTSGEPFLIDGFADPKWDPHSHFGRVCFAPLFGRIEDEFSGLGLKPKVDLDSVDFAALATFDTYAAATLPRIEVVNVRGGGQCDVRCDRGSPWGNPFVEGRDGTRTEVIARFDRWLAEQPALIAALPELLGKRLGCWCAPQPCHCDVLRRRALMGAARFRLKKLQKQWKRLRDLAKRCEYGAIYGGDPVNLYEALVKDFPELRLAQVQETVALIERQMPNVVLQRRRWEQEARVNREIRDIFLGRVRLFPLGHFDPQIVYNYPIQTAAAALLAFAIFRFTAVTHPELLDLERLYSERLLDRRWVARWRMRLASQPWRAPVNLLINGHDSLIAESDEEDAAQVTRLLEDAMTQEYTHPVGGWRMRFPGEAASARRWSET